MKVENNSRTTKKRRSNERSYEIYLLAKSLAAGIGTCQDQPRFATLSDLHIIPCHRYIVSISEPHALRWGGLQCLLTRRTPTSMTASDTSACLRPNSGWLAPPRVPRGGAKFNLQRILHLWSKPSLLDSQLIARRKTRIQAPYQAVSTMGARLLILFLGRQAERSNNEQKAV